MGAGRRLMMRPYPVTIRQLLEVSGSDCRGSQAMTIACRRRIKIASPLEAPTPRSGPSGGGRLISARLNRIARGLQAQITHAMAATLTTWKATSHKGHRSAIKSSMQSLFFSARAWIEYCQSGNRFALAGLSTQPIFSIRRCRLIASRVSRTMFLYTAEIRA